MECYSAELSGFSAHYSPYSKLICAHVRLTYICPVGMQNITPVFGHPSKCTLVGGHDAMCANRSDKAVSVHRNLKHLWHAFTISTIRPGTATTTKNWAVLTGITVLSRHYCQLQTVAGDCRVCRHECVVRTQTNSHTWAFIKLCRCWFVFFFLAMHCSWMMLTFV